MRFHSTIELHGKTATGTEVPPDLGAALEADPHLRGAFHGLTSSAQRRHVLSIEAARTDQTRRRRIAQTVDALRAD